MLQDPANIKDTLYNIISDMENNVGNYAKNPEKDFTRNRKLGFKTLVEFMLSISGGSINKEIYKHFKTPDNIMTASAFVQQRDKLSDNAFSDLFYTFNNKSKDSKLLNGKYRLLAVDGSDLHIATNKNSDSYIKPRKLKDGTTAEGYNLLHLNALYDVLNKTYTDCTIVPKNLCSERQELVNMIKDKTFTEPTIVLADRGYPSMNMFAHFNHKENLHYLFRTQLNQYAFLRDLPDGECDVDKEITITTNRAYRYECGYYFLKHYKQNGLVTKEYKGTTKFTPWDFGMFEKIKFRVLRFKITDDTYETIFTSLPREEFSIQDIKKLYNKRWGIETSFRELKYSMGLLNFHSKREDFIIQEIYAHLIMYNYCERIMRTIVVYQCKDRQYSYQINYTMAMLICMDYFKGLHPPEELYNLISLYILPIREGRKDKRKQKGIKSVVFFIYRIAA